MESNIPEDLVSNILLRLPVKSLVRFKSAHKSWSSFISDPNFNKLHFDRTAPQNHQLLVYASLSGGPGKARLDSLDLERSLQCHSLNFIPPVQSSSRMGCLPILGVCRGFILLGYCPTPAFWPPTYLIVWNPSTSVCKTVPYSSIASNFVKLDKFKQAHRYGFVYDATRDDYFVIIAWIEGLRADLVRLNCLEFFSIRTDAWRHVDANLLPCRRYVDFSFVNGAIHWLAITKNNGEPIKAIVAFDLMKRNVSEIPLPHDGFFHDPFVKSLRLEVMGGCLCLLNGSRQQLDFDELWVMREYNVKSSWTKFNYVSAHAVPRCYFRPIYFTKGGEVVGLDDRYMTLVMLDDRGELKLDDSGELLHYYEHCCFRKHYIYTESLFSLPSDDHVQALEDVL